MGHYLMREHAGRAWRPCAPTHARPYLEQRLQTLWFPSPTSASFVAPSAVHSSEILKRLLAEDPAAFRLVQHELPIFGPPSELAARASVAAARQGKQQELRRRFMRTPMVAEEASVRRVAETLDLDVERLLIDMSSAGVQAELDRTRALADLFGFIGTPGLVIGRTVLSGAVPLSLLRQIAEEEKAEPFPAC